MKSMATKEWVEIKNNNNKKVNKQCCTSFHRNEKTKGKQAEYLLSLLSVPKRTWIGTHQYHHEELDQAQKPTTVLGVAKQNNSSSGAWAIHLTSFYGIYTS